MVLTAMAGMSGSSLVVSQEVGCRPRNTQCCFRPGQAPTSKKLIVLKGMHGGPQPRGEWRCLASAEPEVAGDELENPESESARKKAEADRLRAAEKFMVVGTGEAECGGCGYEYSPKKGDPEYPISPGVFFNALPDDWSCPICGAPKDRFNSRAFEVAGFAENQKYGLGTNSMTSGQKSLLIFGSLFAFFLLFIAGYFIE